MSVEISNAIVAFGAVCHWPAVSCPPRPPIWYGSVGFAPFAPHPAPDKNSERIDQGIYRLACKTPLSFTGGEAMALGTLNDDPYFWLAAPVLYAFPYDAGRWGDGSNVLVFIEADEGGQVLRHDMDFSVAILQFPQQHTL